MEDITKLDDTSIKITQTNTSETVISMDTLVSTYNEILAQIARLTAEAEVLSNRIDAATALGVVTEDQLPVIE